MLHKIPSLFPWKHNKTKIMAEPVLEEDVNLEDQLEPCTICGRTFLPQPLIKHAKICERNLIKKRKTFSSLKQRVAGTDLAPFHQQTYLKKAEPPHKPAPSKTLHTSWKEKHQQLVSAIQEEKHVPVESPSITPHRQRSMSVVNSGFERCPTCDRQFGPKAFDRHVEWCRERQSRVVKSPAVTAQAKERLDARIKYRVPPMNRPKKTVKEKYQSPVKATDIMPAVKSTGNLSRRPSIRKTPEQKVEKPTRDKLLEPIPKTETRVRAEKSPEAKPIKREPLKSSGKRIPLLKVNTTQVNTLTEGLLVSEMNIPSTQRKKLTTWSNLALRPNESPSPSPIPLKPKIGHSKVPSVATPESHAHLARGTEKSNTHSNNKRKTIESQVHDTIKKIQVKNFKSLEGNVRVDGLHSKMLVEHVDSNVEVDKVRGKMGVDVNNDMRVDVGTNVGIDGIRSNIETIQVCHKNVKIVDKYKNIKHNIIGINDQKNMKMHKNNLEFDGMNNFETDGVDAYVFNSNVEVDNIKRTQVYDRNSELDNATKVVNFEVIKMPNSGRSKNPKDNCNVFRNLKDGARSWIPEDAACSITELTDMNITTNKTPKDINAQFFGSEFNDTKYVKTNNAEDVMNVPCYVRNLRNSKNKDVLPKSLISRRRDETTEKLEVVNVPCFVREFNDTNVSAKLRNSGKREDISKELEVVKESDTEILGETPRKADNFPLRVNDLNKLNALEGSLNTSLKDPGYVPRLVRELKEIRRALKLVKIDSGQKPIINKFEDFCNSLGISLKDSNDVCMNPIMEGHQIIEAHVSSILSKKSEDSKGDLSNNSSKTVGTSISQMESIESSSDDIHCIKETLPQINLREQLFDVDVDNHVNPINGKEEYFFVKNSKSDSYIFKQTTTQTDIYNRKCLTPCVNYFNLYEVNESESYLLDGTNISSNRKCIKTAPEKLINSVLINTDNFETMNQSELLCSVESVTSSSRDNASKSVPENIIKTDFQNKRLFNGENQIHSQNSTLYENQLEIPARNIKNKTNDDYCTYKSETGRLGKESNEAVLADNINNNFDITHSVDLIPQKELLTEQPKSPHCTSNSTLPEWSQTNSPFCSYINNLQHCSDNYNSPLNPDSHNCTDTYKSPRNPHLTDNYNSPHYPDNYHSSNSENEFSDSIENPLCSLYKLDIDNDDLMIYEHDETLEDVESFNGLYSNAYSSALSKARLEQEVRNCCSEVTINEDFDGSDFISYSETDLTKFNRLQYVMRAKHNEEVLFSDQILEMAGREFLKSLKKPEVKRITPSGNMIIKADEVLPCTREIASKELLRSLNKPNSESTAQFSWLENTIVEVDNEDESPHEIMSPQEQPKLEDTNITLVNPQNPIIENDDKADSSYEILRPRKQRKLHTQTTQILHSSPKGNLTSEGDDESYEILRPRKQPKLDIEAMNISQLSPQRGMCIEADETGSYEILVPSKKLNLETEATSTQLLSDLNETGSEGNIEGNVSYEILIPLKKKNMESEATSTSKLNPRRNMALESDDESYEILISHKIQNMETEATSTSQLAEAEMESKLTSSPCFIPAGNIGSREDDEAESTLSSRRNSMYEIDGDWNNEADGSCAGLTGDLDCLIECNEELHEDIKANFDAVRKLEMCGHVDSLQHSVDEYATADIATILNLSATRETEDLKNIVSDELDHLTKSKKPCSNIKETGNLKQSAVHLKDTANFVANNFKQTETLKMRFNKKSLVNAKPTISSIQLLNHSKDTHGSKNCLTSTKDTGRGKSSLRYFRETEPLNKPMRDTKEIHRPKSLLSSNEISSLKKPLSDAKETISSNSLLRCSKETDRLKESLSDSNKTCTLKTPLKYAKETDTLKKRLASSKEAYSSKTTPRYSKKTESFKQSLGDSKDIYDSDSSLRYSNKPDTCKKPLCDSQETWKYSKTDHFKRALSDLKEPYSFKTTLCYAVRIDSFQRPSSDSKRTFDELLNNSRATAHLKKSSSLSNIPDFKANFDSFTVAKGKDKLVDNFEDMRDKCDSFTVKKDGDKLVCHTEDMIVLPRHSKLKVDRDYINHDENHQHKLINIQNVDFITDNKEDTSKKKHHLHAKKNGGELISDNIEDILKKRHKYQAIKKGQHVLNNVQEDVDMEEHDYLQVKKADDESIDSFTMKEQVFLEVKKGYSELVIEDKNVMKKEENLDVKNGAMEKFNYITSNKDTFFGISKAMKTKTNVNVMADCTDIVTEEGMLQTQKNLEVKKCYYDRIDMIKKQKYFQMKKGNEKLYINHKDMENSDTSNTESNLSMVDIDNKITSDIECRKPSGSINEETVYPKENKTHTDKNEGKEDCPDISDVDEKPLVTEIYENCLQDNIRKIKTMHKKCLQAPIIDRAPNDLFSTSNTADNRQIHCIQEQQSQSTFTSNEGRPTSTDSQQGSRRMASNTSSITDFSPRFVKLVNMIMDNKSVRFKPSTMFNMSKSDCQKLIRIDPRKIPKLGEEGKLPGIMVHRGRVVKERGAFVLPDIHHSPASTVDNEVLNRKVVFKVNKESMRKHNARDKEDLESVVGDNSEDTYNPFLTAERQLMELLECDDFKSFKPSSPINKTANNSTRGKPKDIPHIRSVKETNVKNLKHKRASVIDPPSDFQDTSDIFDDNFELMENFINENLNDENLLDKLDAISLGSNKASFSTQLNEPDGNFNTFCDDLPIDPRLINEYDNLSIPEHLSVDDSSPAESLPQINNKFFNSKPVSLGPILMPKVAVEPELGDFIMSVGGGDRAKAKKAERAKTTTKVSAKNSQSSSSSFARSPSPLEKKKNLSSMKRSISILDPVKPKNLRNREDVQNYFHEQEAKSPPRSSAKADKEEIGASEDLFSVDDEMYEEYKKYEQMYLQEKEEKLRLERKVQTEDDSHITKISGDSAYGSLNRSKVKVRSTVAKLLPLEHHSDSASSSGSETGTVGSAVGQVPSISLQSGRKFSSASKLTKFCHECGNKYPLHSAKFCVECGVKRLPTDED